MIAKILNRIIRHINVLILNVGILLKFSSVVIRIGKGRFKIPLPVSYGLKRSLALGSYEKDEQIIIQKIIKPELGDRRPENVQHCLYCRK